MSFDYCDSSHPVSYFIGSVYAIPWKGSNDPSIQAECGRLDPNPDFENRGGPFPHGDLSTARFWSNLSQAHSPTRPKIFPIYQYCITPSSFTSFHMRHTEPTFLPLTVCLVNIILSGVSGRSIPSSASTTLHHGFQLGLSYQPESFPPYRLLLSQRSIQRHLLVASKPSSCNTE